MLKRKFRTRYLYRDVVSAGIRVGYWPCVAGWFIQFNYGRHYRSFWYGIAFEE